MNLFDEYVRYDDPPPLLRPAGSTPSAGPPSASLLGDGPPAPRQPDRRPARRCPA